VYAWIWRKLPGGTLEKLIGAVALTVITVAALWAVVFPVADTLLPFGDVQVTGDQGGDTGNGAVVPDASAGPTAPASGASTAAKNVRPSPSTKNRRTPTRSPSARGGVLSR
jgi:hypothetical protein